MKIIEECKQNLVIQEIPYRINAWMPYIPKEFLDIKDINLFSLILFSKHLKNAKNEKAEIKTRGVAQLQKGNNLFVLILEVKYAIIKLLITYIIKQLIFFVLFLKEWKLAPSKPYST